jgi:hypothetical protein
MTPDETLGKSANIVSLVDVGIRCGPPAYKYVFSGPESEKIIKEIEEILSSTEKLVSSEQTCGVFDSKMSKEFSNQLAE